MRKNVCVVVIFLAARSSDHPGRGLQHSRTQLQSRCHLRQLWV